MKKESAVKSYKKSRHLHQHVAGVGKYKTPDFDLSNGRPAAVKIQISTGARKLIDILAAVLDEQSEVKKGEQVYTGINRDLEAIDYSKSSEVDPVKIQHILPIIEISLYDLAARYMGGHPGGWDEKQVDGWVFELASKNHKIRYDRKEGGKIVGTVDVFLPIIYAAIKRDASGAITYLLKLNPIFRDQIVNQFVLLPNDYHDRLRAAFASNLFNPTGDKATKVKPTKAGLAFCDYLILQLSFKKKGFTETLTVNRLAEIMGISASKLKKEPQKVWRQTGLALAVAMKVGLISSYTAHDNPARLTFTARGNWHTLPPKINGYETPGHDGPEGKSAG